MKNPYALILLIAATTAYGQIDNPISSLTDLTVRSLNTSEPVTWALDAVQTNSSGPSSFTLTLPDSGNVIRVTNTSVIRNIANGRLGAFYYVINQSTGTIPIENTNGITVQGGRTLTLAQNEVATLVATGPTNVSVAGRGDLNNVTLTGDTVLSGVNNTMPNATNAASGASLMTRDLTDNNPLEAFSKVRPLLAFASNTGTGSTATLNTYALGTADLRAGTNVSGYARAQLYRGVNNPSHLVSSGINLSQNLALSFLTIFREEIRTNSAVRFIVGGAGSGAPAPANSNALTGRGFGIEISRTATTNVYPAPSIRARLFAHDGTNYFTSDYTTDFAALNMEQFILNYTTNGTVSLRFSTAAKAPARPSTTPVLTLTNGPVGSFTVGQFIEYVSVNASDVAPIGTTDCIYFGGMLEVKD